MNHIYVRISDSVLDDKDWTICRLTLVDNVVTAKETIQKGVYRLDSPDVGTSLRDVVAWTHFDSTGSHPETYHEAFINGKWVDAVNYAMVGL